jgi:hypothetical protein
MWQIFENDLNFQFFELILDLEDSFGTFEYGTGSAMKTFEILDIVG